ncbi:Nn.00g011150.m01.CDS01 [Neocucurbitaria sp. VM-36]
MASQESDSEGVNASTSTQNTQYDKIGSKYNKIKTLPATEPEVPSILNALGDIRGKRCLGAPSSSAFDEGEGECTDESCVSDRLRLGHEENVLNTQESLPRTNPLYIEAIKLLNLHKNLLTFHVDKSLASNPIQFNSHKTTTHSTTLFPPTNPLPSDLACGTGKSTILLSLHGASTVHAYDISPAMISAAQSTYPSAQHPTLHFDVADCSLPHTFPPPSAEKTFDIVFAGWFLNYAGTESELTNMFRVIEQSLAAEGGRFVGVTTNVNDERMQEEKRGFYGLDVLVLDGKYVAPRSGVVPAGEGEGEDGSSGEVLGIKARVVVEGNTPFQFDVFQFTREVYERCAERAGLELQWRELVLPEDERRETGYWDRFVERPTFVVVEAVRAR